MYAAALPGDVASQLRAGRGAALMFIFSHLVQVSAGDQAGTIRAMYNGHYLTVAQSLKITTRVPTFLLFQLLVQVSSAVRHADHSND